MACTSIAVRVHVMRNQQRVWPICCRKSHCTLSAVHVHQVRLVQPGCCLQTAPRKHACELLHAGACHHCDAMRCDAMLETCKHLPGFIDSHVPPQERCHGDGASIKMPTRRPFATSWLQLQQQCSLRESTDGEYASPQRLYMHGCMRRRTLQRSKLCACGEKCHTLQSWGRHWREGVHAC